MTADGTPLVEASHLHKRYPGTGGRGNGIQALIDVSLSIAKGETLALVGESGSGKSTLGRVLLALEPPDAGRVSFDGTDLASLSRDARRVLRRRMQLVFQDAAASLDPRLTAGASVREGLTVHALAAGAAADARVRTLFDEVGLQPELAARFPHELSSGQRQRAAIARTLAVDPEFIVLDEPLTALDTTVQAQVVTLLGDLQRARKLTYLFITHDLAIAERVASRVAVMYLGRIVEEGPARSVTSSPGHPFTIALRSSVPAAAPGTGAERILMRGDPPVGESLPGGCAFHPRCPHPAADAECGRTNPSFVERSAGHRVACSKAPFPLGGMPAPTAENGGPAGG